MRVSIQKMIQLPKKALYEALKDWKLVAKQFFLFTWK